MRVVIDPALCMQSGQCAYMHPEVFVLDEHGVPGPTSDDLDADLLAEAEEAALMCPSQAIVIDPR